MGDAHIGQLVIREWRISSNEKFLARFELIEKYFYGIFDMRYCLHLILVFHQVSGRGLVIPNVELVYKFNK